MVSITTTAPIKVMGRKALDFMSLSPELAVYCSLPILNGTCEPINRPYVAGFFLSRSIGSDGKAAWSSYTPKICRLCFADAIRLNSHPPLPQ